MRTLSKNKSIKNMVTNNNIMLSIMMAFVIFFILILCSQIVNAKEKTSYTKTFTTIEISTGDTLLSIADTYKKPNQNSYDYIDEVISMNHISDEQIHAGCYLVIPTYEPIE